MHQQKELEDAIAHFCRRRFNGAPNENLPLNDGTIETINPLRTWPWFLEHSRGGSMLRRKKLSSGSSCTWLTRLYTGRNASMPQANTGRHSNLTDNSNIGAVPSFPSTGVPAMPPLPPPSLPKWHAPLKGKKINGSADPFGFQFADGSKTSGSNLRLLETFQAKLKPSSPTGGTWTNYF